MSLLPAFNPSSRAKDDEPLVAAFTVFFNVELSPGGVGQKLTGQKLTEQRLTRQKLVGQKLIDRHSGQKLTTNNSVIITSSPAQNHLGSNRGQT